MKEYNNIIHMLISQDIEGNFNT